jgi:hypothetical protein
VKWHVQIRGKGADLLGFFCLWAVWMSLWIDRDLDPASVCHGGNAITCHLFYQVEVIRGGG